jgi:hypothetical protein
MIALIKEEYKVELETNKLSNDTKCIRILLDYPFKPGG